MRRNRLFSPFTWPVYSFLLVIALGALLLRLPASCRPGRELDFVDAAFLSTSAVCVTGLSPVDVGAVLSPLGKVVLLALMQLGGLGVMTYTSIIFLLWRKAVPFSSREAVSQALLGGDFSLRAFLFQVLGLVLSIEAVAAFLLYWHDPVAFYPFSAVFHAVSSFCNAGFSLNSNNLMSFRQDWVVIGIICSSVFLGGVGFGVLRECLGLCTGGRLGAPVRRFSRFSRLVLKTALFLVLFGAALIYGIEHLRTGNEADLGEGAALASTALFQSVTARTAGFNIVDTTALSEASLLVLMALMFVGGGPGSCAGGIKVVAFRVLAGYVAGAVSRRPQIVLEGRGVPGATSPAP
jgi:trk system potassium uptake protein TrkH